jgi:hypothetical protein
MYSADRSRIYNSPADFTPVIGFQSLEMGVESPAKANRNKTVAGCPAPMFRFLGMQERFSYRG